MPGSPKKRARREAMMQQGVAGGTPVTSPKASVKTVQDAIPDAVESRARARTGAHYARSRVQQPSPVRPLPIGAATRAVTDDVQARAMQALAEHLHPGITLRIERTRPAWAAGFLEDYPIQSDDDSIRSLMDHLRDEHGGQHYRLTALGAGDQVLYTGSVPIAGPVRERGRPITRADWEEGKPGAAALAAPKVANPFSELAPLMQFVVQAFTAQSSKAAEATLSAVQAIANQSAASTAQIVEAFAAQRNVTLPEGQPSRSQNLAGGLTELLEGIQQLEAAKRALGVSARSNPPKADKDDEGPLDGALGEVTKRFFTEVLSSQLMKRRTPPTRPVRRVMPPPPTLTPPGDIPDALPQRSGQTTPSN